MLRKWFLCSLLFLAIPAAAGAWTLYQNTPNPFGGPNEPTTMVRFEMTDTAYVVIRVMTVEVQEDGQRHIVNMLYTEESLPTTIEASWDGTSWLTHQPVTPGIYAIEAVAYQDGWEVFRGEVIAAYDPVTSPVQPASWGAIKTLYR